MVAPGDILDERYRLVRQLGAGAMGAVYAAKHTGLETDCAVKVLHPELAVHSVMVERFRREAMEAARIDHTGIAKVTDFGRTREGAVYLVMELLEGETLSERIARGPLAIEDAVRCASETLDALAAAHARGVTHRDVKPENLFLARDVRGGERIKVLDFGIAKVREGTGQLTGTGAMIGTPIYMAPEQMRDAARADARADVYSVGATLFHMLAGAPPVDSKSIYEVIGMVVGGQIERDPRKRRPEVPEWLAEVVAKSLAHDPDARFSSAAAMKEALERGLADREAPQPAGTSPTDPPARPTDPTATVAQTPLVSDPSHTVIAASPPVAPGAAAPTVASPSAVPPAVASPPPAGTPTLAPARPRRAAAPRKPHPLAYGAGAVLALLTVFGIAKLASEDDPSPETAPFAEVTGREAPEKAPEKAPEQPSRATASPLVPTADTVVPDTPELPYGDEHLWKVPVEADDPARGPADALVTIVQFSGYQCPFCARASEVLDRLLNEHSDLRVVWKDFPLSFHARAQTAANVANAVYDAHGNDRYWRAHTAIFSLQKELAHDAVWQHGGEVQRRLISAGVLLPGFSAAVERATPHPRVQRSLALGNRLGVHGIPTFFINGRRILGARSYEQFDAFVRAERSKVRLRMLSRPGGAAGLYDEIIANGRTSAN